MSATAAPSELAHVRALDDRLREAVADGVRSWDTLLVEAEGADPARVAQRVLALGLPIEGLALRSEPAVFERWTPELHALDFEWYFESQCAAELAARVAGPARSVLCLGTPTVAFALLADPRVERVTLVDHNPLTAGRHQGDHGGSHGQSHALETIVADLASARLAAGHYDAAVFDAPWYPLALRRWLSVAAIAVRPGGTILFALLRPLHRPGASIDRAAMLGRARALGRVTVYPAQLRYRSPRFEQEAMATLGLSTPATWRRADLVEITRSSSPEPETLAEWSAPRSAWVRFVVGSEVIHLDLGASDEPGDLLHPIDARSDYRYASLSTRDPRRAAIGLWTSRSRVARVRQPTILAALLERLAETGDHAALPHHRALSGLRTETATRVLAAIRTLVDRT